MCIILLQGKQHQWTPSATAKGYFASGVLSICIRTSASADLECASSIVTQTRCRAFAIIFISLIWTHHYSNKQKNCSRLKLTLINTRLVRIHRSPRFLNEWKKYNVLRWICQWNIEIYTEKCCLKISNYLKCTTSIQMYYKLHMDTPLLIKVTEATWHQMLSQKNKCMKLTCSMSKLAFLQSDKVGIINKTIVKISW